MARDILDAVYGCVIGGAIGDALGAPVEGWYYTEIREKYGRVTEFQSTMRGNTGAMYGGSTGDRYGEAYDGPPSVPGQVTDDTALSHYLALAIVRQGGRVTPQEFANVWTERLNPNRFWTNERIIRLKLRAGMNPWDAGKGAIPAGVATMAIAPVGIINAGNPRQAYQDGFNIAYVNQDDANRDAAATLAAGVAAALVPGITVERVLETMVAHASWLVRRAIDLTMDLAYASDSVDAFAERFYAKMLDWTWPSRNWDRERFFSGSSLEIVPVAMALLHLCRGEVNDCIVEGASFGRDCDTIARAVGSLGGAMRGASAIRQDWIEQCEAANVDLFEDVEGDARTNFCSMAERLVGALHNEQRATQARAEQLAELLADAPQA